MTRLTRGACDDARWFAKERNRMGVLDGSSVFITGGGRGQGCAHAIVPLPVDSGHLAMAGINMDPK